MYRCIGFAILCVTIPPRGQVALPRPEVQALLDFIHLQIISTSMKRKEKTKAGYPGVIQEILFNDKEKKISKKTLLYKSLFFL